MNARKTTGEAYTAATWKKPSNSCGHHKSRFERKLQKLENAGESTRNVTLQLRGTNKINAKKE
ncbi:hypothetical protein E2C01_019514 [Portunus trituberculatus]|uniref:Uncharacterized protein n=1 Tax=Portunus trituberculatus TaxID=210409 RepID=A0A5B7DZ19_PORTR|nr:hypothetical protein [Portunus trituberculatus]